MSGRQSAQEGVESFSSQLGKSVALKLCIMFCVYYLTSHLIQGGWATAVDPNPRAPFTTQTVHSNYRGAPLIGGVGFGRDAPAE